MTDEDLLHDLMETWEEDVEDYPDTIGGEFAAAAVDVCRKELKYVIENGELIEERR